MVNCKTMSGELFGFLNIYKPSGLTSFDVIRQLRKVLKIKQIGHTGTLDPLAEGVLPVCIGKSTKLIDYLQEDKGYIADVRFGWISDTYDVEGALRKFSDSKVVKAQIVELLKEFEGEIEQVPPIYSAIKLNGKKLYEYARKGRSVDEIEIPKRKVVISKISLLEFDEVNQTAKIEVYCSKGTYIRSIINDLGQKSGVGAVMTGLIRTKSGKFTLENTVNLAELVSREIIVNNLINPLKVLSYKYKELNDVEYSKVVVGQQIEAAGLTPDEIVLLTKNNQLVSIAKLESNKIKVIKVFV